MIFSARLMRMATGACEGICACWSEIGPQAVLGVPQISMMSWVIRSKCATVVAGSTPRSNRWPASVEKLKRRERPAIDLGHQKAAST